MILLQTNISNFNYNHEFHHASFCIEFAGSPETASFVNILAIAIQSLCLLIV